MERGIIYKMNGSAPPNVTQLLLAWGKGDQQALNKLIPLVEDELHRLAARHMRGEKRGHTLQTTALVNEAYCRLVELKEIRWQNRAQFFAIASQMMRRVLIDHARKRISAKRPDAGQKISLDVAEPQSTPVAVELVYLDRALTRLEKVDSFKSRIVEMKFFGGLTTEEIAEVEKVSLRTIEREWRKAKAWLYGEIDRWETAK